MANFPYSQNSPDPDAISCPILKFGILDSLGNTIMREKGLIDTGAGISTITKDIVKKLRIPYSREVELTFWTINRYNNQIRVQEIAFSTYEFLIDIKVSGASPEIIREGFALFYETIIGRNILTYWDIHLNKDY